MDEKLKQKPKWLRKLEQESWQAELIISGVAIFGTLQLPDLIDHLADQCVGIFSSEANLTIYLFFIYCILGAYILITSFVLHFVLRTLWVGLVGLNSVFPGGINVEGGYYPRHFMERLRREVDYGDTLIQQLEEVSSMMFSLCTYFVLIFVAVNIDVVLLFLLWSLLCLVLPVKFVTGLLLFLGAVLALAGIFISVLNAKRLRDTAFAKKFQYPIFASISKMMFHVLYRPIMQLSFTFFSNLNLRRYYAFTLVFFGILLFFSVFRLKDSTVMHFAGEDSLDLIYNRSDRLLPRNYENMRQPDDGRILSAVIESDRVSGASMRVFVPVFSNEKKWMEARCGPSEAPDSLGKEEARTWRWQYQLDCLTNYHRFYVNDSLYLPTVRRYAHENQGESGVLVYLPTDAFRQGENLLRVEKVGADSVVHRSMQVPFQFEPTSYRLTK